MMTVCLFNSASLQNYGFQWNNSVVALFFTSNVRSSVR